MRFLNVNVFNYRQMKALDAGKELSNPLEGLDDTTLLEVSAALRGHCVVNLADFQVKDKNIL